MPRQTVNGANGAQKKAPKVSGDPNGKEVGNRNRDRVFLIVAIRARGLCSCVVLISIVVFLSVAPLVICSCGVQHQGLCMVFVHVMNVAVTVPGM